MQQKNRLFTHRFLHACRWTYLLITLLLLVSIRLTPAQPAYAASLPPYLTQGHNQGSDTASNIICAKLTFFGHGCNTAQAAPVTATAHLAVADAQATPGISTTLTVTLSTGGNAIAAATFALNLEPAKLHFRDTDTDEDGVPDAITLHVPPSMSKTVIWNTDLHRLEVAVFGTSLPLPTLSDGVLATVQVQVITEATAGATPLALTLVSLSDPDGNDLPVTQANGTFTVQPRIIPPTDIFLPLVVR